jgi:hypothetical protein
MPQYTPSTGIIRPSLLIRGESRKEVAAERYLWRDILKMRREQAARTPSKQITRRNA